MAILVPPKGNVGNENPSGAAAATHPLRRLMRYARPHRRQVWAASACPALNKLFDLAPRR